MSDSKVFKKGQITIPEALRDEVGLKPGDRVRCFNRDGTIHIRSVISAKSLYGMLKHEGPPITMEEIDAAIYQARMERWERKERNAR